MRERSGPAARTASMPDPRSVGRAVLLELVLPALLVASWSLAAGQAIGAEPRATNRSAVVDHRVTTIDGRTISLESFRGQAMLIVNTASKCGYTPQYEGLEALHQRFEERGLVVVGFPSNDFGNQEPGSNAEIARFCKRSYGVSFPMMAKIHTTGEDKAPLYRTLTERTPQHIRGEIRWNFTKFLVDPTGRVVARFEPGTEPLSDELIQAVHEVLP